MTLPVKVSIGKEKYTTNISVANHNFLGDEPEDIGGADKGPAPYDLLLASLGSCSAITMKMYADRKEWDLEGVEIVLHMEKEKIDGNLHTQIKRDITLKGNLDEKQRQRLLKISDACPVANILEGNVSIESGLVE